MAGRLERRRTKRSETVRRMVYLRKGAIRMLLELTQRMVETIRSAAKRLTGHDRRAFQAEVTQQYCAGRARRAESIFGWGRDAVATGLEETRTGVPHADRISERGRSKTEEVHPELVAVIHELVAPQTQVDPKFQSPLAFTRMTARAVREQLLSHDVTCDITPAERTVHTILHRLGDRMRRVRKTIPQKKVPATNLIFSHLSQAHATAKEDPETLRISLDTKAKVKIGPFSRGGTLRSQPATRASDHDMHVEATLTPAGILEVDTHQLHILFGTSRDTSDFVADALEQWWATRKSAHPNIHRLLLDLDNGPQVASTRTQFMKRLVEFSDRHQLTIELAYYPPYHSKYNPVERCWGILENPWNGTLLSSMDATLSWASTMTWRGVRPIVQLSSQVYETGVRITKKAFASIAARLKRSDEIPRWSLGHRTPAGIDH